MAHHGTSHAPAFGVSISHLGEVIASLQTHLFLLPNLYVGQEMETVKQTYQCSFVPRPCLVCDSFQDTWGLGMRLCYDTKAKGNELFTPRKKINLHKNLIDPKPYSACFDHNECLLFQHVVLRKLFTYQTLV